MRCPFLRESLVKYCGAAAVRKMIVRPTEPPAEERCSTPSWESCAIARDRGEEHCGLERCPYLHESLVQYCSASAIPKYIPYSEARLSRCGNEGHKYCDLYATLAHEERAEEAPAPTRRAYARNHLWLEVGTDGTCHIGIDGFLAKLLGSVDRVTFLTSPGRAYPAAVLTAAGTDLTCVFPNRLNVTAANTYLRAH